MQFNILAVIIVVATPCCGGCFFKTAVEHAFRNAYPYKGFVDVFPAGGLINQVQNNFPYPNAHRSAWSINDIKRFVEKFDNIEENENFTLYK